MLRRMFVLWFLTFGGYFAIVNGGTSKDSLSRRVRSIASDCEDGNSTTCKSIVTEESTVPSVDVSRHVARAGKMFFGIQKGDDANLVKTEDKLSGRGKGGYGGGGGFGGGGGGGGGGKGGKKGGYGGVYLMFGAMKAAMLYFMIHAVAALAGKALMVAKVALAIAVAIALKKSDHGDKTSYEIVKHPHHSYLQTHSTSVDFDHHGGYDTSGFGGHRRRRYSHIVR